MVLENDGILKTTKPAKPSLRICDVRLRWREARHFDGNLPRGHTTFDGHQIVAAVAHLVENHLSPLVSPRNSLFSGSEVLKGSERLFLRDGTCKGHFRHKDFT